MLCVIRIILTGAPKESESNYNVPKVLLQKMGYENVSQGSSPISNNIVLIRFVSMRKTILYFVVVLFPVKTY